MFSLTVQLCHLFPAINPLTLRNMRAGEVFKLFSRLSNYIKKQPDNRNNQNQVIRRPAGDDWF